jgi:predicted ATPase
MSTDGISALERGERRSPYRDTVEMLATGLGLSGADRERFEAAAARQSQLRRRPITITDDKPANRHNLPLALASFLGRERECDSLQKHLAEHRLVTLTGPGGVGKTRLAIETARPLIDRFPDGVWLVELAPVADPMMVGPRVAATLGIPQRLEAMISDAWIAEFVEKHALIVLDNCEHVLGAAAAVAQRLLERCTSVRILATSREALHIAGERVIRLDPLAMPRSSTVEVSLGELRDAPAIRMFVDRARDIAPHFALADDDHRRWQTLHTVCRSLDGMPLAIELAAARMNAMNLETLAGALDRQFLLFAGRAGANLTRHQTLRALLDWSYGLLSDAEQSVFRRLAAFAAGWTLEAAEAICVGGPVQAAEILAILSSLVDKSLVVVDTRSAVPRYEMLETTRAYAHHRLVEHAEYAAVAAAHATYFRDFLRRANTTYGKPSVSAWLADLEPELDNLRAALRWTVVDQNDVALGATIAAAQHATFLVLALNTEHARWCELALSALGPAPDPVLEAPLQLALCQCYSNGGYSERSVIAASRAAEMYRTLPEGPSIRNLSRRASLATALAYAGLHLTFLGRNDEADRAATEGLAIARDEGEPVTIAFALIAKSRTVDATQVALRRILLTEALDIARSLEGSLVFGLAHILFGDAEFTAGEFGLARKHARTAIEYYRRNGLGEDLAVWGLSLSALSALAAGDVELAQTDARAALMQAHRVGPGAISGALLVMSSIAVLFGEERTAAQLIGGSDALAAALARPHWRPLQMLLDQTLERLRGVLAHHELAASIAEGRTWSLEQTVTAALRVRDRGSSATLESHGR